MKKLAEAVEEKKMKKRPVSKLDGAAKQKGLSPQVAQAARNGVCVTSGEAWLPPAKRHTP